MNLRENENAGRSTRYIRTTEADGGGPESGCLDYVEVWSGASSKSRFCGRGDVAGDDDDVMAGGGGGHRTASFPKMVALSANNITNNVSTPGKIFPGLCK